MKYHTFPNPYINICKPIYFVFILHSYLSISYLFYISTCQYTWDHNKPIHHRTCNPIESLYSCISSNLWCIHWKWRPFRPDKYVFCLLNAHMISSHCEALFGRSCQVCNAIEGLASYKLIRASSRPQGPLVAGPLIPGHQEVQTFYYHNDDKTKWLSSCRRYLKCIFCSKTFVVAHWNSF